MLQWRPKRLLGAAVGVAIMLVIVLVDGLFVLVVVRRPLSLASFVLGLLVALSLPSLAVLGYLLYGLFSLRYRLGRDAVVVSWAGRREIIPLTVIESVASDWGVREKPRIRGLRWPGYCVARRQNEGTRSILVYSTGRPSEELLITTPAVVYVISPSNRTAFVSALSARQQVGPAEGLQQTTEDAGVAALPIWRDWVALSLLASGVVANVTLFGYIIALYPSLPGVVPLLSERGQVSLIGPKGELLQLPVIGLTVLLANALIGGVLHRQERFLTHVLTAIALLAQILLWSAVVSIIR
jgi:hypothetical protein